MKLKHLNEDHPALQLNHKIAYNLINALKLKNAEDLTPQYLENISAAQLRNAGLTMVAVAETQQWLMNNGVSLKRKPPKSTAEIQAVKRAIATLDAFQFGIENVQSQLNFLENESI